MEPEVIIETEYWALLCAGHLVGIYSDKESAEAFIWEASDPDRFEVHKCNVASVPDIPMSGRRIGWAWNPDMADAS